jgi:hypothetical protein
VYSLFVSFPSFSIIEGSFKMYSGVVLWAPKDERLACPRSGDISHFLFGGQVV